MSVSLVPADATAALRLRTIVDELCANNPSFGVSIGPVNEIVLHSVGEYMMAFSHYEQMPPPYRGPDDDTFPPAIGMRA